MSSEDNVVSISFTRENWIALQHIITECCKRRGVAWIKWGENINSKINSSIVNANQLRDPHSQPENNISPNVEDKAQRIKTNAQTGTMFDTVKASANPFVNQFIGPQPEPKASTSSYVENNKTIKEHLFPMLMDGERCVDPGTTGSKFETEQSLA